MNIAKYALNNKFTINFLLVLILILGITGYQNNGRLEDAPFTIKQARISTVYPGASAEEVELLITEPLEEALQNVRNYDIIRSESRAGYSIIDFYLKSYTKPEEVPQIWDEMRRKITDIESSLPAGASAPMINDDFGDVFGYYFALTADEGFSFRELEEYSDFIKRELSKLIDVKRIGIYGVIPQVINIEISNERLATAGINPAVFRQALSTQNRLIRSGYLYSGEQQIEIQAKGYFEELEEIRSLRIPTADGSSVRVDEIADVSIDYQDPPIVKMRVNGKRAVGIGVSTINGGNAIDMGAAVSQKLDELVEFLPKGIEMELLYSQDQIATEANNDFIINLLISVLTVVGIILFAYGFRGGLLIGSGLIFAIVGTIAFMQPLGIEFHRTSLASFIIAMGMLVDNAIVVTDNALIALNRGVGKRKALTDGAFQPQWGLFGATLIAIVSFLPFYVAKSATGELIAPLFIVLSISLMLSWIFSLTQTTVHGMLILKTPKTIQTGDVYDKPFYKITEKIIFKLIKFKWLTLAVVILLLFGSFGLMRTVKRDFIAPIEKPMFRVDLMLPQGTPIKITENRVKIIEEYLLADDRVKNVSVAIGSSSLRYYLASKSFSSRPNYANFTIEVYDSENSDPVMFGLRRYIENTMPDALPLTSRFIVAAQPEGTIEALFLGPNADTLRMLTEQAMDIMRKQSKAEFVRNSWGNKIITWAPTYSQFKGQKVGISRDVMANALSQLSVGIPIGQFRSENQNIPILVKDKNREDYDLSNLGSFPLVNKAGQLVFLEQITDNQDLKWDDWVIRRYNRQRGMAAQAEPIEGVKNPELEGLIMDEINAIPLPEGYKLMWDGMFYKQADSVGSILAPFPLALLIIMVIIILLFNSGKTLIVLMSMIPLIIIGIAPALALSGLAFSFFALLGVLGLVGMVIKNGIVLIEQADIEIENGMSRKEAIVFAAKARAIPVSMASGTTICGMIPLVPDALFGGLAVTMMGGLFAATVLTIFVLPVIYSIVYAIKN